MVKRNIYAFVQCEPQFNILLTFTPPIHLHVHIKAHKASIVSGNKAYNTVTARNINTWLDCEKTVIQSDKEQGNTWTYIQCLTWMRRSSISTQCPFSPLLHCGWGKTDKSAESRVTISQQAKCGTKHDDVCVGHAVYIWPGDRKYLTKRKDLLMISNIQAHLWNSRGTVMACSFPMLLLSNTCA